jgi:hypothetical protein
LLNELGLGGSLENIVSGGAVAALVTGETAAESTIASDIANAGATETAP